MKKAYAAQLAKPKQYRFTLHTASGRRLAELEVSVQKFLLILRSYNSGHPHAFTLYTLRALHMPATSSHLYYVVIHPEPESWIPHRSSEEFVREAVPIVL
ncbi:MAG: hypothetical protein JWQ98_2351 [Chlorobi bacterium]|nr:hypothetical protein [Chlorobiota bacterium]